MNHSLRRRPAALFCLLALVAPALRSAEFDLSTATIADIPWTGCDGVGKVIPLIV